MATIVINIEPDDGTPVGWLVGCFSLRRRNGRLQQTAHRLTLTGPVDGKFRAETVDLPSGEYAVHCDVIVSGKSVSLTVDGEPNVVFPPNSQWPMTVKVSATENRDVATWYFQH